MARLAPGTRGKVLQSMVREELREETCFRNEDLFGVCGYIILVMERPRLYCEQNVFCRGPAQKISKFKMSINRVPSQKPLSSSSVTELHPSDQHSLKCQEIYIQNVAGDLHFSKDVIKDRGLATLSYQEWDSKDVYNASNVIPHKGPRTILKTQPKQHKLEPKHRQVRHVETSVPSKKIKSKSCTSFGNSAWRAPEEGEQRHGSSSHLTLGNLKPRTFLTEDPTITRRMKVSYRENLPPVPHGMSGNATEVLLRRLTKASAQWIVGHHMESKDAKERLSKHYGLSKYSTELINDEHMAEEDFSTFEEPEMCRAEDLNDVTEGHEPETLLPVFYKIPGYLPPQKKVQEAGGRNKTAEFLAVKHFEFAPPLRLQDLINPKAGKHVSATENDFERELYSGASKIIHQKNTKLKNCIVMESNSRYEKHVQQSVPRSYKEWTSSNGQPDDIDRPLRPVRGAHRWVALPTVVVDKMERSPQRQTSTDGLSEKEEVKPGPLDKKQVLQNIVAQWRSAWWLSAQWKEATLEQLTRDLGNVHNSQKISALITIASSAAEAPQQIAFPAEILNLVSNALREEDNLIRMAAALCQYLIREVSEDARKIMLKSLESGTDADSWAAAQCLALEGNHSYLVMKRILEQMFAASNKEIEEQAMYMLQELSKHTNLIHALLGEALNSGNWGEKIMSCKALSLLRGKISQGVKEKLSHLMWNDWSPAVRGAAAKALGKLDQGKEVHDQIRKHLESESWKTKVEALALIGFLQIMTAQLLPGFLQCFENDFLAVRRQACRTAGLLQIKDEMVMNCLYELVQNDPVWKIKAHAIKAIGKIGHVTPRVKELMLWAVRVKEPGVRLEAYRCIASLNLCDCDVQQALQDRAILESHELASREVKQTLTALNMAHNGNQEMMTQVKHQQISEGPGCWTPTDEILMTYLNDSIKHKLQSSTHGPHRPHQNATTKPRPQILSSPQISNQQKLSKLCQKEVLFPRVLKMDEDLASGQAELEQALLNPPDWKHKIQEQGHFWDIVGTELSGHSCPSAMSGMEYQSADSELQVLMEKDSRPGSHQTVSSAHTTSELSIPTAGTEHSTDTLHSNLM